MKLKLLFLLTISLILVSSAFAQKTKKAKLPTAKIIIQNYVKAIGGEAAIKKQTTRFQKGSIEMSPMGLKGTAEIWATAPNKSYSKSNISGIGEIIEVFDGNSAWATNPIQGSREKKGDELLQTKLFNDFYREINLEKLYPKMELKGVEKLFGKDVYVIVATPTGLSPETFYFDNQTGLLLRQDSAYISPEGTFNLQTTYEDYRDVDGVKIAFKVSAKNPQFEIITIISEVKFGLKIDENLFAKPK